MLFVKQTNHKANANRELVHPLSNQPRIGTNIKWPSLEQYLATGILLLLFHLLLSEDTPTAHPLFRPDLWPP